MWIGTLKMFFFPPDPTLLKVSPEQQESFASLPDLHLENVSRLTKKKISSGHD